MSAVMTALPLPFHPCLPDLVIMKIPPFLVEDGTIKEPILHVFLKEVSDLKEGRVWESPALHLEKKVVWSIKYLTKYLTPWSHNGQISGEKRKVNILKLFAWLIHSLQTLTLKILIKKEKKWRYFTVFSWGINFYMFPMQAESNKI